MLSDSQMSDLKSHVSTEIRRTTSPPKKNGNHWTSIIKTILGLAAIAGSVSVGYIVQTKAEASNQRREDRKEVAVTYETQVHAKEAHDRLDRTDAATRLEIVGKIDSLYQHVIERKPRQDVRVRDEGVPDGN